MLFLILKDEEFSFKKMIEMLQGMDSAGVLVQEFLTLFPDALTQGAMDPIERARAESLIDGNLELLFSFFSTSVNSSEDSIRNRCLCNWIKIADPKLVLLLVAKSDLIEKSMATLSINEEAAESTSDLLLELIAIVASFSFEEKSQLLIERLGTALVTALPKIPWREDGAEGGAIAFAFGCVLVDFLDAFITNSTNSAYEEILLEEGVIKGLIEAQPPSLRLADLTFRLWTPLSRMVSSKGSAITTNDKKVFFIKKLAKRAWIGLISMLQWPLNMNRQQIEDFRSFRHLIGDALKDLISIFNKEELPCIFSVLTPSQVGGQGLNKIQPVERDEERVAEAVFTAARLVAECIDNEQEEPIMGMMKMIPSILQRYPSSGSLWYAAVLFISAYAPWTIATNDREFLVNFQMEILFSILGPNGKNISNNDGRDLVAASSLALESLVIALVSKDVSLGETNRSERWITILFSIYQTHPNSERIFSVLAHMATFASLQTVAGIMSMVWNEDSNSSTLKLGKIEILLKKLSESIQQGSLQLQTSSGSDLLENIAQQSLAHLGVILENFVHSQSNALRDPSGKPVSNNSIANEVAGVIRSMILFSVTIPLPSNGSIALIEALSNSIMKSIELCTNTGGGSSFIRVASKFYKFFY